MKSKESILEIDEQRRKEMAFMDKDGNNLSKFGRFTVKRIALDAPQGK